MSKKNRPPVSKHKFLIVGVVLIVIVKMSLNGFYNNDVTKDEVEALSNLGNNIKGISEYEYRGSVVTDVAINRIIDEQINEKVIVTDDDINKIAIVIDDLGLNKTLTNAIIDIDIPMTLAFLPYAKNLDKLVKRAIENGHEVIIHTPMEPIGSKVNPGPVYFKSDMSDEQFNDAVDVVFSSFDGYVGINNHMGSKATQDKVLMTRIMETLKDRDLYFLDSKTIGDSIGESTAIEMGVKSISRDVFIDHENNDEFILNALDKTNIIARKKGVAVAIGHPRKSTIKNLTAWIDEMKDKPDIEFVTIGSLLP